MGRGGHPDHLSETAAPRCALIQGHNAATARRGAACNTPKAPPHEVRPGTGQNPGPSRSPSLERTVADPGAAHSGPDLAMQARC